jgi:preprotein translocase subunit YajC
MMNSFFLIGQAATNAASPASGTGTAGAPQTQGGLLSMVPFLVIMGVMIFFMFRNQRKQAKQRQEMLNAIKAGDRVVTAGGIMGTVKKVHDKTFIIEIAEKVEIEVTKGGVSGIAGGTEQESK